MAAAHDGPFDVAASGPLADDSVLRYLISVNLTESETQFRSIIRHTAEDPAAPKPRDLVIATVGSLMSLGGLDWPVIFETISALKRLGDEKLKDSAVAIANGQYLLIPRESERGIAAIDLTTMLETVEPIRALVSTVYSCSSVWAEVERALGGEG